MFNKEHEICFLRRNRTRYGGAENYLVRLSKELDRININHQVIYSNLPRFLPSWLHAILYNLKVCRNKGGKFYFSLERITCPDIYRAGDGVHRQYLSIKRLSINPINPVYLYLEKRCFNNATRIIVNSHMIKNEIIHHYAINPNKIFLVYPGIEAPSPKESGTSIRDEFHISDESKIILFVGAGFERKGVDEMLRLLAAIKEDYIALIVGKDKRLPYYRKLSEKLGIADKAFFTGPRTDVDRFYRESDIFLLPTHYDPFSNVVIEAMAHGNAVITTRQNGACEVIHDHLVMENPKDENIRHELLKLLRDNDYLQQVKDDNLVQAKKYSIERNANETMKVVMDVILKRN